MNCRYDATGEYSCNPQVISEKFASVDNDNMNKLKNQMNNMMSGNMVDKLKGAVPNNMVDKLKGAVPDNMVDKLKGAVPDNMVDKLKGAVPDNSTMSYLSNAASNLFTSDKKSDKKGDGVIDSASKFMDDMTKNIKNLF